MGALTWANEKYEVNASLTTKNADWCIALCIRKNGSDIGFGWHYSVFAGILGVYLPFIILNIHTPFVVQEDDA